MSDLAFQPSPGLFTDTTTFGGKGGWIDGSNVRFWNGRWQTVGGWTRRGTLTLSDTPNGIHEWKSLAGTDYIAWSSASELKVELAGVLYDIKPALVTGRWTFANYGETLIANLSGGKIYQWSLNTAMAAAAVTNAPVKVTCVLVTPQRQLLALGCNEEISGTFNGRCVRCSDIEDITDWTTTATNNVDEIVLDGATSDIVTARMLGPYIAVWTSSELFIGTFVGDPGQTYRFDRVAGASGCIALRAVAIAGGAAYWLTPDLRFMAWSPGAEPQTIACPLINNFRSTFPTTSITADTFATYVAAFNEIWFTYSNTGAIYRGRYVAFSLADGKWFKGELERRAMHQGLTGLLGALNNGILLNCESGTATGSLSAISEWSIQSSDIALDPGGRRRMMIRGLRPDFEDQAGDVAMQIFAKDYPQGTYRETDVTLPTLTQKKDFRASGSLVSIRFSGGYGGNTFARQGVPVFDVQPMGGR